MKAEPLAGQVMKHENSFIPHPSAFPRVGADGFEPSTS
jgi:hypothetical protein